MTIFILDIYKWICFSGFNDAVSKVIAEAVELSNKPLKEIKAMAITSEERKAASAGMKPKKSDIVYSNDNNLLQILKEPYKYRHRRERRQRAALKKNNATTV